MSLGRLEKAFFYNTYNRDVVADIAQLTEKIFKQHNRIVILCRDQDTAKVVDDALWSYKYDSFIPHSIKKKGEASLNPILVTKDLDEGYEHNILLVLNGVSIRENNLQQFAKVYYFFDDQDINEKENARSMWKSFSLHEVDCKYWINKKNKWVLASSR